MEIFATGLAAETVARPGQSATTVVSGGPESLVQLADRGDRPGGAACSRATSRTASRHRRHGASADGLRRRAPTSGCINDNTSYSLAPRERRPGADDPPAPGHRPDRAASRWRAPAGCRRPRVVLRSWLVHGPSSPPAAAFDGDPSTAWVAGGRGLPGRVGPGAAARARAGHRGTVGLLRDGPWRPRVVALRVTTDAGSKVVPVPARPRPRTSKSCRPAARL